MQNDSGRTTPRRSRAYVGVLSVNFLHVRHPWVNAWWSAAFPGFGYLAIGMFAKGMVLTVWEFIININANINTAMVHSFTGRFELAKQDLDRRWLLLYLSVYLYGIWDSYRLTVETNKMACLAARENAPFEPFVIRSFGINFLDKRIPALSVFWSLLMPGVGHLYVRILPNGFFILSCWIVTAYYSRILLAVHYSLLGDFQAATAAIDPEWLLFMPSIYGFAMYDAYVSTVELNALFEKEQRNYLTAYYQNPQFAFPGSQPNAERGGPACT